jgi:alpha-1,3-rhamnosyl/mannosyltransferase
MTHFVLDARTASPHFPGIGRYVGNLGRAMGPLLGPGERLTVLEDPRYHVGAGPEVARVPVSESPFSVAQQSKMPRLLKRLGADLYHSAYLMMPYRPGVPTVLTVYDLIPLLLPAQSTRRAALFFRAALRLALHTAGQIIVISDATRRDLLAHFDVSPERVTVIPLAADPAFAPPSEQAVAEVRRRYALPERYVLYLGSDKPHKNLAGLTDAWARIAKWPEVAGASLVIAGAGEARAAERGSDARIRWLGPAPEADLPALYGGATFFVFPSLYEGFGLPVLEAMACGTPVVCSDGSSLPEVAGDAAVLVDARDPAALGEAIASLLNDAGRRDRLRERGLAQAARFNWESTARRTLELYRVALRQGFAGERPPEDG